MERFRPFSGRSPLGCSVWLSLGSRYQPSLSQHDKLDALYEHGLIDLPPNSQAGLPTYRQYLDSSPGQLLQDIWAFQPHTKGCMYADGSGIDEDVRWIPPRDKKERLGYPTQKPIGLLERIIKSSSNEGDVVLDPFCGCGTTIHAAQNLGRQWIGIDVCVNACKVIEERIKGHFDILWSDVEFIGMPKTRDDAAFMATRDPFRFERWAVSLVDGMEPNKKQRGGRRH